MSNVTEHVDVGVPVRTAYNQWTQFEDFPEFMEGVVEIRQLDDTRLHWKTRIGGVEREFDAEITEQHPDHRIAWRSTGGTQHAGVVTFHRLDDATTRVTVQMDTEPEGLAEQVGDKLGVLKRRVKGDLERFKELIERRGAESGEWRGDVENRDDSAEVAPTARFSRSGADALIEPSAEPLHPNEAPQSEPVPRREQSGL